MKAKKKGIEEQEALRKIFNYSEFMYQQPRDSNGDSIAFLNICRDVGNVIKSLTLAPSKDRRVK